MVIDVYKSQVFTMKRTLFTFFMIEGQILQKSNKHHSIVGFQITKYLSFFPALSNTLVLFILYFLRQWIEINFYIILIKQLVCVYLRKYFK